MGGRGGWSFTADDEDVTIFDATNGGGGGEEAERLLPAYFQHLENGNRVSTEATLRSVESDITQHGYETGVIIDEQGFVVSALKGNEFSVPVDYANAQGNTITHNHPNDISAFSSADVRSGSVGAKEIRATTKTDGTSVLTAASSNPRWSEMADAYHSFLSGGQKSKVARQWLADNASNYGLKYTHEG